MAGLAPPVIAHNACGEPTATADAYEALLARLRRQHVPYSVLWELTHRCNLRCIMCYNVARTMPELSTAECLDVLEQLAAAGALQLTFTGGEPLTRADFFVIAGRARALGFALNLKTNGTLITSEIADRIAELLPLRVDISLLGATPETSDAVMGGRNTLPRLLRGVRLLQARGVRVQLNTLLLGLNIAERRQMLDLALELGVSYQQTFKISPTDNGGTPAAHQQLSRAEMAEVLSADRTPFRPPARAPGNRTCQVGLSSCLISPYGVVYPCSELRVAAGRLVGAERRPFAEIWAQAPIFQALRRRHVWANLADCRSCALANYCEGRCVGLAWKEHGNLYGGHTLACQHAQARYTEQHPGAPIPETPLSLWRGRP